MIMLAAPGTALGIVACLGLLDELRSGYVATGFLATLISAGVIVAYALIEPCRTIERKARAAARREKSIAVNPPASNPNTMSESN